MNLSLMRAYLGMYPAELYYSNSRPHKCQIIANTVRKVSTVCIIYGQMRNYVSTSAENGPAMAGPAEPVPAPMHSM